MFDLCIKEDKKDKYKNKDMNINMMHSMCECKKWGWEIFHFRLEIHYRTWLGFGSLTAAGKKLFL